ncbi:MAG: glycosyltransferase family 39 protein [Acidobacteriota bacterium]
MANPVQRVSGRWLGAGAAFLLIALFILNAIASAERKTPTVDEFAHLPAGYFGLTRGHFSLYGKTPPLGRSIISLPLLLHSPLLPAPPPGNRLAGWYPWRYATLFFRLNVRERGIDFVQRSYRDARLMVVALAGLLAALLFLWGRAVHGTTGGLLGLALFTLDPNILAHSRLATVDLAETLFFFATTGLMVIALFKMKKRWFVMAGLAAGTALATKFTALLLLPVGAGLCLARFFLGKREHKPMNRRGQPLLQGILSALLASVLVVQAAYLFSGAFTPLARFHFRSHLLSSVAGVLPGGLPVPLPADYLRGLDAQQVDLEMGDFPNYLNGQWSRQGWWYYYPLAFLLKTPVPSVLLLLLSLGLFLARRMEILRYRRVPVPPSSQPLSHDPGAVFLFRSLTAWAGGLALGTLLLTSCFLNRLDIGIRYILPAYPFMFLGLGSLGALLHRSRPVATGFILLAVLSSALSTLSVFPHYLGYANLLAGGPDRGWKHLGNSNNDWGQDLLFLKDELQRRGAGTVQLAYFGHAEPSAYGIDYKVPLPGASGSAALRPGKGTVPYTFAPGLYAISANLLIGLPYQVVDHGRWVPAGTTLSRPQEIFSWFRRRSPDMVIGGSILLYRIPRQGPP